MTYLKTYMSFILILMVLFPWSSANAEMGHGEGQHQGMNMHGEMEEGWDHGWAVKPWDMWGGYFDGQALDWEARMFMAGVRTVAILPIMDVSSSGIGRDAWEIQNAGASRLTELVAAELMHRGYLVIPPVDVQTGLVSEVGLESAQYGSVANNLLFRSITPERATRFHLEMISGLDRQYMVDSPLLEAVNTEDIVELAGELGADAVIRGFVTDYDSHRVIEGDLRTWFPPFIGLLSPERKTTMTVSFYLYDGTTGGLIWNGSIESLDSSGWDLVSSEETQERGLESVIAVMMVERIVPTWEYMVGMHPGWTPMECWGDEDWWGGDRDWTERPDWLNPYRQGWHDDYTRQELRWDVEVHDPSPYRYDALQPNYNGIIHRYYRTDAASRSGHRMHDRMRMHDGSWCPPGSMMVSINVTDAHVGELLEVLATEAGFDVELAASVDGWVTEDFKEIDIYEAIAIICRDSNLTYEIRDGVLFVASL